MSSLSDFAAATGPAIKCEFCKLPPKAHENLKEIMENRRRGEWRSMSLDKCITWFRQEYGYPAKTRDSLRHHIRNCLGETWV